jgi:ABC-type nickel/cobalt efflux system permease component RcnA
MSHGVHAVQHEVHHQIEHESDGHGGGHGPGHESANQNRKIALVIAVLALFLAVAEMGGKGAQTNALRLQVEASDLWNFFQAKNIRRTVTIVAAENAKTEQATTTDEARKAALTRQIDEWTKTAARYRSEPGAAHGQGEGTAELMRRAIAKEHERDRELNKYHYFEYASASLQIGIVLCSAAVITGAMALVWLAGATGVVGAALMAMGFFFSHVHLLPGAH